MDGPVGDLVTAQKRHGFRPSHIHSLIGAEGHRELVTALYFADDPHIDSDTVFGVSGSLVVDAKDDPASPFPGSARYSSISVSPRLTRARAGGSAPIRPS